MVEVTVASDSLRGANGAAIRISIGHSHHESSRPEPNFMDDLIYLVQSAWSRLCFLDTRLHEILISGMGGKMTKIDPTRNYLSPLPVRGAGLLRPLKRGIPGADTTIPS